MYVSCLGRLILIVFWCTRESVSLFCINNYMQISYCDRFDIIAIEWEWDIISKELHDMDIRWLLVVIVVVKWLKPISMRWIKYCKSSEKNLCVSHILLLTAHTFVWKNAPPRAHTHTQAHNIARLSCHSNFKSILDASLLTTTPHSSIYGGSLPFVQQLSAFIYFHLCRHLYCCWSGKTSRNPSMETASCAFDGCRITVRVRVWVCLCVVMRTRATTKRQEINTLNNGIGITEASAIFRQWLV